MNVIVDSASFIRANTEVLSPPLVPEIELHLAHEVLPIWQSSEEQLGEIGLPPPFWAFAWAGGQALARHVLDHPNLVRGKHVVDLASGSGLVAIAAVMAGAASVTAADIDQFAVDAIALNAALNHCKIDATQGDLLAEPPPRCGAILVGDLFYEQSLAASALTWLRVAQTQGTLVLIGDPGRSYLPRDALDKIAEYSVPVTRELEDAEIKRTAVWTLKQG
jgi:predicted nicotinamide N-methyase